jgi:hypothetical protein
MAINVYLQNIREKKFDEVLDWDYSLAKIWPIADQTYPLLQYIDPYGNTIFNGMQMPEVVKELDILIADKSSNEQQKATLGRIRELAMKCQKQPHTFLRFRGD